MFNLHNTAQWRQYKAKDTVYMSIRLRDTSSVNSCSLPVRDRHIPHTKYYICIQEIHTCINHHYLFSKIIVIINVKNLSFYNNVKGP